MGASGAVANERAEVLAEVAERVALWNEFRTDDFEDLVVRLVSDAREHWRTDGELPAPGRDRMLDALLGIAESAGGSPLSVRDACGRALRVAEVASLAR